METQQKLSPKFFFLSIGVLVTLIASVSSFLMLAFETLNKQFPDVLNAVYSYGYNSYNYEALRGPLATLIIIFPVFLALSYFWNKSARGALGHIDVIIRRWMIYLILFLAAIIIVVDLVTLVRYFVSGEITGRFILKVVVALVTAGIAGSYYMMLIRKGNTSKVANWIYAIIATLLIISGIVWSFCIMGSPANQRKLRFDDRRVSDLQQIQSQVISYWQQKEKLPEKLNDLKDPLSGVSLPVDPNFEKGAVYEYKMTGRMSFDLCATFALPMPKGWSEYGGRMYAMPMGIGMGGGGMMDIPVSYPYPGPGTNESWDHQSGRTCFSRTIDPEIYPPLNKYY